MNAISKGFILTSVIYGAAGMALGLHMGLSQDHSQMPTHAHIMVIGWVSFMIFGLFYIQIEGAASGNLPRIHFWLSQVSYIVLIAGLWLVFDGQTQYEPILALSAIAYAISFLLFGVIVFRSVR